MKKLTRPALLLVTLTAVFFIILSNNLFFKDTIIQWFYYIGSCVSHSVRALPQTVIVALFVITAAFLLFWAFFSANYHHDSNHDAENKQFGRKARYSFWLQRCHTLLTEHYNATSKKELKQLLFTILANKHNTTVDTIEQKIGNGDIEVPPLVIEWLLSFQVQTNIKGGFLKHWYKATWALILKKRTGTHNTNAQLNAIITCIEKCLEV